LHPGQGTTLPAKKGGICMYGPLEYIALSFPGNKFRGEILPALKDLVEKNTVRIIDFALISKDAAGNVYFRELEEVDPDIALQLDPLVAEINGMFTQDDLNYIAEQLDTNSSAGLLLVEHTWVINFADAVKRANGTLIAQERVPFEVVQTIVAERGIKE
jgi:hypothetical protein